MCILCFWGLRSDLYVRITGSAVFGLFWTYSRSLLRSLLIYMYALQEVLFSNLFVRVRINTGSDVNVWICIYIQEVQLFWRLCGDLHASQSPGASKTPPLLASSSLGMYVRTHAFTYAFSYTCVCHTHARTHTHTHTHTGAATHTSPTRTFCTQQKISKTTMTMKRVRKPARPHQCLPTPCRLMHLRSEQVCKDYLSKEDTCTCVSLSYLDYGMISEPCKSFRSRIDDAWHAFLWNLHLHLSDISYSYTHTCTYIISWLWYDFWTLRIFCVETYYRGKRDLL
jgi:hypothetical protein